MTELLIAVGALLLITGLVVAASLVIESGGRVREPVGPAGDGGPAEPERPTGLVEPVDDPAPEEDAAPIGLVIEGEVARDQLLAAIFAAYAAARLPEANRVAAWVTSAGWPPGRTGSAYRPGCNLRGRPAAVQQLLACDVDERCWVTLNTAVDVDRGLSTRPAGCDVLRGVCELRRAVLAGDAVHGANLESVDRSLSALAEVWSGTTVAEALDELRRAVRDAAEHGGRLVVTVVERSDSPEAGSPEPLRPRPESRGPGRPDGAGADEPVGVGA